eukprot:CAMPEP_0180572260 /NCGR_PEP_ID=MMETSP1037_2-20121125/9155_1 /TAXON_ID=632150 /ORGANISM="Azadinium spinosum, Strain 3D9" /LENGTH=745 /DNA_ID=CAMNT_0022589627 /DNA_START=37 /DNA_END=2271 /DNA_ORIENTATION=+
MGNRMLCSVSMCPKATLQPSGDHELVDNGSSCDPAGAVFPETLEDLNEVDRLLLTFSSTFNLAAVRWLFVLGANIDACDTNGTTCLHAACRSGSLLIVSDLVSRGVPMDLTDIAGWTALHVALFMGRRGAALHLMEHGADPMQHNAKGLVPADLCSDSWLREATEAYEVHRRRHGADTPWTTAGQTREIVEEDIVINSKLRFEPFFVPRAPVLRDMHESSALVLLGKDIFNRRPGQGLAFLVSTGCVRDFPVELSGFLSENVVDSAQVGEFLGENFSLSQTLRLEYINSVRLMGTGIITCLEKVLKNFRFPSDLQKIDRIADGIAQIWWRQHEQLKEKATSPQHLEALLAATINREGEPDEIGGLRLMGLLGTYDTLHQLMLSAILLHWNLYAPLPPSQRLSAAQWIELNADIGARGLQEDSSYKSALREIQVGIYASMSRYQRPDLQLWSSRSAPGGTLARHIASAGASEGSRRGHRGGLEELEEEAAKAQKGVEEVVGWARLVGGGLPSLTGLSGTVCTYRHLRSILSETTSTAFSLASPAISRVSRPDVEQGVASSITSRHTGGPSSIACAKGRARSGLSLDRDGPLGVGGREAAGLGERSLQGGAVANGDRVWLSIRNELLLLAPKPSHWAPYAYVHLRCASVEEVDEGALIITLASGGSSSSDGQGSSRQAVEVATAPPLQLHLQIVFLLPDGRWQVIEVPQLQIQFPDVDELEKWRFALTATCAQPTDGKSSPAEHVRK